MERKKLKHPGITTADEIVNQPLEQFKIYLFFSQIHTDLSKRMYHTHTTYKIVFN
jgi:hypothetical protein